MLILISLLIQKYALNMLCVLNINLLKNITVLTIENIINIFAIFENKIT